MEPESCMTMRIKTVLWSHQHNSKIVYIVRGLIIPNILWLEVGLLWGAKCVKNDVKCHIYISLPDI